MTATKITPGLITTLVGATGLPVASGWEYVSTVTASSSSTLDFTNMTTGYDWQYEMQNIMPGTNQVYIRGYLGVAGPTYRTSSYADLGCTVWSGSASSGTPATAHIQFGYGQTGSASGKGIPYMILTLFDPANSGTKTVYDKKGNWRYYYDSAYANEMGGGNYTSAEAHTSVRFYPVSGNFASGIIKQYRRPNA
jgi:hypothetical protein